MDIEKMNEHIANKDFPDELFGEDPNKDYIRFNQKEISHPHKYYDQKEGLNDSQKSIISDFKDSVNNELKDAKIISIESHLVDDYYEGLHDDELVNDFISVETTINIEHAGKQFSLYYEGADQYNETSPVGCSPNLVEHLKETQNFAGNEDYDYESAAIDIATGLFAEHAQEHHIKEFGAKKQVAVSDEALAQHNAEYMSFIKNSVAGKYVAAQPELDKEGAELMQKLAQEHQERVDAGTLGQDDQAAKAPESGQELSEEAGAELMQKLAQEHQAKSDVGTLGQDEIAADTAQQDQALIEQ